MTSGRRSSSAWVRRTHALLGVISACNLLLLIGTGLLLQHANALHLDGHSIPRRILPSSYRPQDGDAGVRADIVVTDVHSGRILGTAGALILDAITIFWLVILATGLVMYSMKRNGRNGNGRAADYSSKDNGENG